MKNNTEKYVTKIIKTNDESVVMIDDENSANESSFTQIISILRKKYD